MVPLCIDIMCEPFEHLSELFVVEWLEKVPSDPYAYYLHMHDTSELAEIQQIIYSSSN